MGEIKALRSLMHKILLILALSVLSIPAMAENAAPELPENAIYSERGTATCLKCHDKGPTLDIMHTSHAVSGDKRSPMAQMGCESCHGPSSAHATAKPQPGQKRPAPAVNFGGQDISPVAQRNAICISCHESGMRMNWQGSQHQNNDVACTSCHSSHKMNDPVLDKQTQPEICFTCHTDQRAQTLRPSHHPIREGKVACSDCHNPHGSAAPNMLVKNRLTDTCYECHAEKRGPYLWEHAPVREDCMLCHSPHGTVQPRLLKERPPFLCQNCHDGTRHPGKPYAATGSTISGNAVGPAVQSLARGCLNCHSEVHGSNHPSGNFNLR